MGRSHLDGRILTPAGWITGRIAFAASILTVEARAEAPEDRFILPGFVDLHVHGGGGADCMEGEAAARAMARFHARHGTTSLLPTTVTAPPDDVERALRGIGAVARAPEPGAARVLGAHLEGPFISPDALGAQPPFPIPPDLELAAAWCPLGSIRVATIAPEVDRDGRLLAAFTQAGVRVQIGHTTCGYDEARAALARGAAGFTHLFNAMTGLKHRGNGAAGCALAHARHAELILDFHHVEAGAALAALRAVPDLYCITDAVAAAGMPDGPYRLGLHTIHKRGDTVRLEGGGLAGSVLTMQQAFANLCRLGLPIADAARRCSTLAAGYLGLEDRGRLVPGAAADLVVVDPSARLRAVFAEGVAIADPV